MRKVLHQEGGGVEPHLGENNECSEAKHHLIERNKAVLLLKNNFILFILNLVQVE